MSLFDTLGSYQTNVFPYAGCPLRYKAENSKEVEFSPSISNGCFEIYNIGDDVPYRNYFYNYGKEFIVFNYYDEEFAHVIKDGKYRKSMHHRFLPYYDSMPLVLDNYGEQLNIRTIEDFQKILDDKAYYFELYEILKSQYKKEAGITEPNSSISRRKVGDREHDRLVNLMNEISKRAHNESIQVFCDKWYTKPSDSDIYVQIFDQTNIGIVLAECLNDKVLDWEKYTTVKSFIKYNELNNINIDSLIHEYLTWNADISEDEVRNIIDKYNRTPPTSALAEYKKNGFYRISRQ